MQGRVPDGGSRLLLFFGYIRAALLRGGLNVCKITVDPPPPPRAIAEVLPIIHQGGDELGVQMVDIRAALHEGGEEKARQQWCVFWSTTPSYLCFVFLCARAHLFTEACPCL